MREYLLRTFKSLHNIQGLYIPFNTSLEKDLLITFIKANSS